MSMEGLAFNLEQQFEVIYCYSCRCPFAVPAVIRGNWRERGQSFYCPNGHMQHYTESEVTKLQKQVAQLKSNEAFYKANAAAERDAREQTQRRLAAQRGAATRLRNRVKNGVCPCCTRSFADLREHMKSKHPDFQPTDIG